MRNTKVLHGLSSIFVSRVTGEAGPGGPGFVADRQYGRSASVISGGSQTTKLSETPSRCQVSIWWIV